MTRAAWPDWSRENTASWTLARLATVAMLRLVAKRIRSVLDWSDPGRTCAG